MRDLGPPLGFEVREQLEPPGVICPVVRPAQRHHAVGVIAAAERPRGEVRGCDALVCRHTTQGAADDLLAPLGVDERGGDVGCRCSARRPGASGSPLALVSHSGPVALMVTHGNQAMMVKPEQITGLHLELRRAFIRLAARRARGRVGAKL